MDIITEKAYADWRILKEDSGYKTDYLFSNKKLRNGVSFLIRAKNEADFIASCITSIVDLGCDIIFVDNGSSDGTYEIAQELSKKISNLFVYSFPLDVPKANSPKHAIEVKQRTANTLGYYYNFCLDKVTTKNFIKWDADFLPITKNLREMLDEYHLRTRGDNFALYFCGKALYLNKKDVFLDDLSMYNEFRAFSKEHSAKYVNLAEWEEMDQTYLYKANKLEYRKPVFLERKNVENINDRIFNLKDLRDKRTSEIFSNKENLSKIPLITQVNLDNQEFISKLNISDYESSRMSSHIEHFSSIPRIDKFDGNNFSTLISPDKIKQESIVIGILTCEKHSSKIKEIRNTWLKDAKQMGITYYFIIGKDIEEPIIDGDILYINAPDTYEALPKKMMRFYEFIYTKTTFEYVFKVDDDCFVNLKLLNKTEYYKYDYLGRVAGGEKKDFDKTWHFGKCDDEILNTTPYWKEHIANWYGGGYGYFLSRKALGILNANSEEINDDLYEDKAIGDCLFTHGDIKVQEIETYTWMDFSHYLKKDNHFHEVFGQLKPYISLSFITTEIKDESLFKYFYNYSNISMLNFNSYKLFTDWDTRIIDYNISNNDLNSGINNQENIVEVLFSVNSKLNKKEAELLWYKEEFEKHNNWHKGLLYYIPKSFIKLFKLIK
jgi:glycosyltransferase involved in cell wall biosynthesis